MASCICGFLVARSSRINRLMACLATSLRRTSSAMTTTSKQPCRVGQGQEQCTRHGAEHEEHVDHAQLNLGTRAGKQGDHVL